MIVPSFGFILSGVRTAMSLGNTNITRIKAFGTPFMIGLLIVLMLADIAVVLSDRQAAHFATDIACKAKILLTIEGAFISDDLSSYANAQCRQTNHDFEPSTSITVLAAKFAAAQLTLIAVLIRCFTSRETLRELRQYYFEKFDKEQGEFNLVRNTVGQFIGLIAAGAFLVATCDVFKQPNEFKAAAIQKAGEDIVSVGLVLIAFHIISKTYFVLQYIYRRSHDAVAMGEAREGSD